MVGNVTFFNVMFFVSLCMLECTEVTCAIDGLGSINTMYRRD